MFKMKLLLLLMFSTAINAAYALPIVDHDAFNIGDKKAVREVGSGLIWMDFGVNHELTFSQVKSKLTTDYSDWRLPTEKEVSNLWKNLFGKIDGWNESPTNPEHYYLHVLPEHLTYISQICNIFIQYSHITHYLEGRYQSEKGLATALISNDAVYSRTGEFNNDDIPVYEISTLLVKKSRATIPEPSLIALLPITFLILIFFRRRKL